MDSIAAHKNALRGQVLARRDAMSAEIRARKSAAICRQLSDLILTQRRQAASQHNPPVVGVYAAFGSEVDPSAFAHAAEQMGWRVAYPCMLAHDEAAAQGQQMCMRAVGSTDANTAPFIAHPTCRFSADDIDDGHFPVVPARRLDALIVPLVAFDAHGIRLGYGGGCYDRYLPALSPACLVVGVAFNEQRVDRVPADAHDQPLGRIISA